MTDIKYALRSLFKAPGFTLIAIFTIALGIGANTTLFSVFDKLVLRPIDLPDAGRLVRIWTNNKERNILAPVMSAPKYQLFAEQQSTFNGVAASTSNSFVLTREGADPEQLVALNVTANFVSTLGMPLARGRNFTAEEDKQNGPHVCLLSYDVWRTRFGKRENIIGSTIQLDGVGTTVVGVLADGMPTPLAGVQVFEPWPLTPSYFTQQQIEGGAGFLQITARLKPGASFAQAAADVRAISKRYRQEFPGRLDGNNENDLHTWIEEQVGPVRPTLMLLLTAVGFVLLIACANVSNLFLGRLSARHKEIAVRLSLGATRRHLMRQFLLESFVFCAMAASLGTAFAAWALHGVERMFANQLQATTTFSLNAPTLAFTIGLSALSSLMIGFIPAMHATRVNLSDVLKDNVRGTVGGVRGTRFRGFLVVAEVSLSVVLLIGSSLLLVSFVKLQSTPAGFSSRGIASVFVNASTQQYPGKTEQLNFYTQVIDKLRGYPQVKFAVVTQSIPLAGSNLRGVYTVFGRPVPPLAERPIAYLDLASEDYFAMLRIPLRKGRLFKTSDIDGSPTVCVINESFARRLFPNEDAIGQFLTTGQTAQNKLEIIGIVGDVKAIGLNTPPPDIIYRPLRQIGGAAQTIAASIDGDPNLLQPLLRSAVAGIDRSQAVSGFTTMDTQVQRSLGVQRITAWLTGAFAGVALLLSALGLYSVLAYAVTQRTGEIGVRVALGAERSDVIGLILRQGMKLVAIGLVIGLGAAAAGSRVLASLLFGTEPLNPAIFGGVALLFGVIAVLACLVPSWRASRIEALVALRIE